MPFAITPSVVPRAMTSRCSVSDGPEPSRGPRDERTDLAMIDRDHDDRTVRKEDAARPGGEGTPRLLERIGRYRLLKLLGQGGFGRVYLAHDDDLKRSVAVKVPNPERISRPEDVEAY